MPNPCLENKSDSFQIFRGIHLFGLLSGLLFAGVPGLLFPGMAGLLFPGVTSLSQAFICQAFTCSGSDPKPETLNPTPNTLNP